MKAPITTHVLDTTTGRPAAGIPVKLERQQGNDWQAAGQGSTNADGRCPDLLPPGSKILPGTWRITFDLQSYLLGQKTFYPYASIVFEIEDPSQHYHVPLLFSGYGYSTYRGS